MLRSTCGIDTIRVSRIADVMKRKGKIFLDRVYTTAEQDLCEAKGKGKNASLAARFAGKEAVSKALGTGIGNEGVRFTDIEILADSRNRPVLTLCGNALRVFRDMGGTSFDLSLSHDADQAVAICVMQFQEIKAEEA